jgi:hypothetical protein
MGTRSIPGCGTVAPGDVSAAIERWLADAIITAEHATQMRADLPKPAPYGSPEGISPALSAL